MCELRVVCAWALAVLTLSPAGASAQRASTVRELEDELARLVPAYRAAELEADRVEADIEAAEAAAVEQVEIRVGPLRVVTSRGQADLARRLFEQEWARYAAILEVRTERLGSIPYVFHQGRPRRFVTQGAAHQILATADESEDAVRGRIRSEIGRQADRLLPPELQNAWSAMTPLGVTRPPREIYRALATAPTAIAHACFEGDVDACWRGLGQMERNADVMGTWLTDQERRGLVWRDASQAGRRLSQDRAECLAGSDAACWAAAMTGAWRDPYPIPSVARASLLWYALERGGPGAIERLGRSFDPEGDGPPSVGERMRIVGYEESPSGPWMPLQRPAYIDLGELTDIRTHLAAASGLDGDALMREWLASLDAARPAPPEPARGERTTTLLWITLLAAFAARSTRWRFA